ncbi:MAG: sensor histidine kinase KdpD [Ignavibacteriales bacterium]|nr:sensor histidine kinase KdpD [Ignavibacteriales bacterium]
MNTNEENRPDPLKLFDSNQQEDAEEKKGKLKIFFGMCAGVGKTYSLLEAALKAKKDKIDVVIGYVEPHNRTETANLLVGLESLSLKEIEYRETIFKEMDLDAILTRKPKLVLVDELAHSNIPGSRHVKRFQDVLEILNNGIDVYTTLNVQHLESRAETVFQITGAQIRETVPDSIFANADEIELVDITPDELLQRLSEGKIYTPEQSQQAIENFFRKGNLTALREMALRLTAERVDYQLRDYKTEKNITSAWKSGQRLMVAISPSPYSAKLIRWTRRLAYTMEASWLAVYVETDQKVSEENKEALKKNFELAKELGAEIIITNDIDIVHALIRIASENNVTQIIVGKSRESGRSKVGERLLKESGEIDIYIVGGERTDSRKIIGSLISKFQSGKYQYLISSLIISTMILICFSLLDQIGYQTVSLILLLVISLMPLLNLGRGPMILAALIGALSWDYYFIPPQFTLHIGRVEDVLMLFVFFIVATISGVLTSKLKAQQKLVTIREKRTNALYNLLKELATGKSLNDLIEISIKNIKKVFDADVAVIFPVNEKKLSPQPHSASTFQFADLEWHIANWSFFGGQKAGKFTNTLPTSDAQFIPLIGAKSKIGVIGLKFRNDEPLHFEQETLLEAFVNQITINFERELLNELAKKSLVFSESEKLYKTLFNSISHELKTPITTIIGGISSFADDSISENKEMRKNLSKEINIAAERLNRLVENLLDMTRLESGQMKLRMDWHEIPDLIESVLKRLNNELINHTVKTEIQENIPLLKFDFGLLEQALINVIHNSLIYTPENSTIQIRVKEEKNNCVIEISDDGPGFAEETLNKLFEKFYRIPGTKTGGTGLGLSIAKGFIEAHTGSISAKNRKDGGAVFIINIPIQK